MTDLNGLITACEREIALSAPTAENYSALVKVVKELDGNRRLALAIRKVNELHQASYVGDEAYKANPHRPYTKSEYDCIREVVGDDPIATILDCLFTAGYGDIYEFADEVLGPKEGK